MDYVHNTGVDSTANCSAEKKIVKQSVLLSKAQPLRQNLQEIIL